MAIGGVIALGKDLSGVLIRDKRKKHGFRQLIEGDGDRSRPLLVFDDVLSSGRTMERTIATLRREGFNPCCACVLFEFGWLAGRSRVDGLGIELLNMARLEYVRTPKVIWRNESFSPLFNALSR